MKNIMKAAGILILVLIIAAGCLAAIGSTVEDSPDSVPDPIETAVPEDVIAEVEPTPIVLTKAPATATVIIVPTEEPTEMPPTSTPLPTLAPILKWALGMGTYMVGTDIEPGIYVGEADDDLTGACYWERLSGLDGDLDSIIANDLPLGQFYIEVYPEDVALKTGCDITPIEKVPAPDKFLTSLPAGTYIIGRDIEAGTYRGEAGDDILKSCYLERLSSFDGSLDAIITNDIGMGQFFVEVAPTDYALKVGCPVELIE